ITDVASGTVLYSRNAATAAAPASSQKLATAAAALTVLGAAGRLATTVVRGPGPGSIVLVGGGDPTLAAARPPAGQYPRPATLRSLAAATAGRLRARGETAVRLSYDSSLFTGPAMASGWTASYVSTGNVSPISALEVDQGRLTATGKPEDADNALDFRPRSLTPAADAARAFASFLAADGVRVRATAPGRAPAGSARIAAVYSPPVSAMVDQMLRESNNVIAEDLARQVALRTRRPASFSGGAAAVTAVLRRLGIRGGVRLLDGSGLSPGDRLTPGALARLVTLAAGAHAGPLRPLVPALPVAGFSGTLAPGQSMFGSFGKAALGTVRAKTGNLTTVASLTGLVTDASGQSLGFAFMAPHIPAGGLQRAITVLDRMATALAGCGCG
ncbi:MAG: D-alanyl-D-alanine carboxypeptidase/D-alanyl-D-alanine-endopeptidase, partial [Actinobacteria bacterium]|nr:D-alanyl-D-alanine carboxypeptidase/D-alanyl-D-alanine-endopeptidase [Actinomycetota bacterium]